jgi:hypothetical protein
MSHLDEARKAEVPQTEEYTNRIRSLARSKSGELWADQEVIDKLRTYKSLCKSQHEVIKGYEEQEAVWLTLVRDIEFECDGHEDIDNNGGPNFAMRVMNHVRAALEKTGVEL